MSPTHERTVQGMMMNPGEILTGLPPVLLSHAMMVSPEGAREMETAAGTRWDPALPADPQQAA